LSEVQVKARTLTRAFTENAELAAADVLLNELCGCVFADAGGLWRRGSLEEAASGVDVGIKGQRRRW